MEKTTDLEVIRKTKHLFTWGRIIKIHEIDVYTIVEFEDPKHLEHGNHFHVYVEGKDQHTSTHSLDGALLFAIARKNLEANEARFMAQAAVKLFEIKEP